MRCELIPHTDGISGWYAQFVAGPYYQARPWSEGSVYLDGDAFEVVCYMVGHFNLLGPETLSGTRLLTCISDLEAAARHVSGAASPQDLVNDPPDGWIGRLFEGHDWHTARRDFSVMLRDLAVWMRGVAARGQPVTCLGL